MMREMLAFHIERLIGLLPHISTLPLEPPHSIPPENTNHCCHLEIENEKLIITLFIKLFPLLLLPFRLMFKSSFSLAAASCLQTSASCTAFNSFSRSA
jgi:hypothetical protein